jgi:serine protease Do
VKRGDVVLAFNGQPIERVGQLSRSVAAVAAGDRAELTIWRDGKEQQLTAEIGPMPASDEVAAAEPAQESANQPRLGLALAPLTPEQRQQLGIGGDAEGVVITEVAPDGPAPAKGLEAGDVIISVDNRPVNQPADVVAAVREAHEQGRKTVLLYVSRDGNERFEAIPLATS